MVNGGHEVAAAAASPAEADGKDRASAAVAADERTVGANAATAGARVHRAWEKS
jgi:hypothetical protein